MAETQPLQTTQSDDDQVDNFLEGCDLDFREDVLGDDEAGLFALFAGALDPESPVTVEQVASDWQELFS